MTDIKIVPSPRIDYCGQCKTEHGYECPQDKLRMEELDTPLIASIEELKASFKKVFEPPLLWLLDRLIDVLQWISDKLNKK